jgi:hypothetical protein
MHTVLWFENMKGKDDLEDLGVDGSNINVDIRGIG